MGGNALLLKGVVSDRIPSDIYHEFVESVISDIQRLCIVSNIALPKGFLNKESHGDLDVLISSSDNHRVISELKKYKPTYVSNGNVHSFAWDYNNKIHQVDIILCPIDTNLQESYGQKVTPIQSQMQYMTNGDCGNIIGKICRTHNFKFSHEGLFRIVRKSEVFKDLQLKDERKQIVAEIFITADIKEVLSLLRLDYTKWIAGFNDMEDLTEWAYQSPFVRITAFNLESDEDFRHADRMRCKKRNSYELMSLKEPKEVLCLREAFTLKYGGWLKNEVADHIVQYKNELEFQKEYKSRFNGEICSNLWNLSGKDLGNKMGSFINNYSKEFIVSKTHDEIITLIKEF